jgi:hypothetical protein
VQQRLADTVDELQNVIQEIRTTIFDLHGGNSGTTRLRQRISDAVAAFSRDGLRVGIHFVGPLSVVDAVLADHAEAVVLEAVSNAVRHANARTISVTVRVEDELTVEVVDDGCGIPPDITPSGTAPNISGQLTEIVLGSASLLPTSQLTWPYLNYLTTLLGLEGYTEAGSGLPRANTFGLSDPFCVVSWGHREIGRSEVIKETLDPVWEKEQAFAFRAPESLGRSKEEIANIQRAAAVRELKLR